MMGERFTLVKKRNGWVVDDNSREKFYLTPKEVVKLLNELNDERMMYKTTIDKRIVELEEDINDYHNALFDLHKKYDKLEKENEKLRKELDNFKPVMFQDVRKGTVILYSKGD